MAARPGSRRVRRTMLQPRDGEHPGGLAPLLTMTLITQARDNEVLTVWALSPRGHHGIEGRVVPPRPSLR